jgi:tetratricopeptide (TPR) repeat protein
VAQACGDFPLQVVTRLRVGQAYLTLGNYHRAIECFQKNIRSLEGDLLHERFGEAWLPSVVSRSWLVFALGERGEFAEGIATAEEGLRIADVVGQPLTVINASRALGQVYLRKGDLNGAIRVLERAREMCDAWNIRRPQIPTYLGYAYVLCGRLAHGLQLLERGNALDASTGEGSGYAYHLVHLSEAYRLAHRVEDAVRSAQQAHDFARDHNQPPQQAWALWGLAEIDSHREPANIEGAEASYKKAMALSGELGMRPLLAHCHFSVGKLYVRTGKCQEAREHLMTATAMYGEMDMRLWLEQAEAAVSRL